jgi:hypothetical protein
MTSPVVRWFPGMKLSDVEKQIIACASKYFPNSDQAAVSLGISKNKFVYKLAEIKRENEAEERAMDELVAGQNEAILRFKRMAASATVAQEKMEYRKNLEEENRIENSIER